MIRRRVLAAATLTAFALGSALFWNGGKVDWIVMGTNLAVAAVGFVVLHYRWKARERLPIGASEAGDIFS